MTPDPQLFPHHPALAPLARRIPHRWLNRLTGLCLALAAMVACLLDLGIPGIVNGSESLYVEAAREMVLSGNLAVPTLNGLPYLEKPPLLVWLLALNIRLFGLGEWSVRLVTAGAALALVTAVTLFYRRVSLAAGHPRTGYSAGYILTTTVGMDLMSRVAMPDLLLTALYGSATLALYLAISEARPGFWRAGAALLGLAALVKGPLPLALAALLVAALWVSLPERRPTLTRHLRDPWAWALLLTPLTAWVGAIELAQPGAARYFIVNEQILRFLGKREPHDYYTGSVFYYLPRLFLFMFPWVGALGFGWLAAQRQAPGPRQTLRRFLWLGAAIPFLFFSLSSAKANYYIILCLPAMALLTADYLPELLRARRRFHFILTLVVPVILLIIALALRRWAVATGRTEPLLSQHDGSGAIALALLLIITLCVMVFLKLGWRRAAMLGLGGLILPLSFECDHLIRLIEPYTSARPLARYIQENHPDAPVFLYQDFEAMGALPIYLNREVPIIDSQSADLTFGRQHQPDHPNFVTVEAARAAPEGSLILVMPNRDHPFSKTPLPGECDKIAQIGKVSVYRKH